MTTHPLTSENIDVIVQGRDKQEREKIGGGLFAFFAVRLYMPSGSERELALFPLYGKIFEHFFF